MVRLNLSSEPQWLDLGYDVQVLVDPMTSSILYAARADELCRAVDVDGTPVGVQAVAMAKAVAVLVIRDWRGVGDADGEPIAPSREGICALIELEQFFDAFQVGYLSKWYRLATEKKGSALSPNGTLAGAPNTAAGAKPSARNARGSSTRRKPSKAGSSGT